MPVVSSAGHHREARTNGSGMQGLRSGGASGPAVDHDAAPCDLETTVMSQYGNNWGVGRDPGQGSAVR